jgi:hypothetical protein
MRTRAHADEWKHCLVALLALAGCATTTVSQPDPGARYRAEVKACRAGYDDPALDALRTKFPVLAGLERPTPAMLSDSSRPSERQKPLILLYDRHAIDCANGYAAVFGELGPEYLAIHVQATTRAQAARSELYEGKLTFGEYVRRTTALTEDARAKFTALNRRPREAAPAVTGGTPAPQMTTFKPLASPAQPKL